MRLLAFGQAIIDRAGWLQAAAMAGSGLLFCSTWAIVLATREPASAVPTAAAVVLVTPAPTLTLPPATLPASPTLEATATAPSVPAGTIKVGGYVQVVGTEGNGLSLRAEPGTQHPVKFLGLENEVFRVDDGPRDADGFVWWFLVNPYDASHNGWAVQNYLQAVQGP